MGPTRGPVEGREAAVVAAGRCYTRVNNAALVDGPGVILGKRGVLTSCCDCCRKSREVSAEVEEKGAGGRTRD